MAENTVRKSVATDFSPTSQQSSIEAALKELGLSQLESSLYQAALRLGPRPASTLAKSVGVQRTRVYDVLASLHDRGLIENVERNSVGCYAATSPDRLLSLIRKRRLYIDQQLDGLENCIPSLFEGNKWCPAGLESKVIRGVAPVGEALIESLSDEEDSLFAISDVETIFTCPEMNRWIQRFQRERISRGIMLRISVQGAPNLVVEKDRFREILSSPTIPGNMIALVTKQRLYVIEEGDTIQSTEIESVNFCAIFRGFFTSWLDSFKRDSQPTLI